jgi:hypothetical protein
MNLPRLRPLLSILPVLLLVALLAGCGSSSSTTSTSTPKPTSTTTRAAADNGISTQTPEQIVAASTAAAKAAKSVHVVGAIADGDGSVELNLELLAGQGGQGTIAKNGTRFAIVVSDGTVYLKGSASFYKSLGGSAAAELLKGKWLKAPASGSLGSLAKLTDIDTLMSQTLKPDAGSTLTKAGQKTIDGQPALGLKSSKGGTLYIATTGKPYPLQLAKTGGSGKGTGQISFKDWDKPVTILVPKDAIDVAQLKGAKKS